MKDPYGYRGRLLSDIAEYDFEIEHIKRHNNVFANVLSRLGIGEPNYDADPIIPVLNVAQRSLSGRESQPDTTPRWHDMGEAQKADIVIAKVLQWIAAREWPSFEAIK